MKFYVLWISINVLCFISSMDMEKECERLTNENQIKCAEMMKTRTESSASSGTENSMSSSNANTNKFKSRVQAVFYDNQGNVTAATTQKGELFNLAMPINTCRSEDCEFCCLSTNRCGSKKQCVNSKYYIQYVHIIFFLLILTLIISLIVKCYQTDPYPDQVNTEKIDNSDLNELINMFSIIRNNRKKLIS